MLSIVSLSQRAHPLVYIAQLQLFDYPSVIHPTYVIMIAVSPLHT